MRDCPENEKPAAPSTVVTGPYNPFLLQTFRAFLAETHEPTLATHMTIAHVQFCQAQSLERVAAATEAVGAHLDAIRALVTSPVELERLIKFVQLGQAKRAENKSKREKVEAFDSLFTATDEELES